MSELSIVQIISIFSLGLGFVLSVISKSTVVSLMGNLDYNEFKEIDQAFLLNDPFVYYKQYKFLDKVVSTLPSFWVGKFYRYSHKFFLFSVILFLFSSLISILSIGSGVSF